MNTESNADSDVSLPTAEKPRRRWLTVLLGVLIFAGGFATGAGSTIIAAVHRLQYAIHHPEEAPARIAARLHRKLGLDETQQSEVEAIVAKHQAALAVIRREFQPKVMAQLEQIRDEISQVLTEPQREKWIQMFNDVRDRWLPPMPQADSKKPNV